MKTTIYTVSYVCFDGYDDNLYLLTGTFTNEDEARKAFKRECDTARNAALFADGVPCDNPYSIDEEKIFDDVYEVSRCYETYRIKVELKIVNVNIPLASDRRKYGMTLNELRDKIAAFTGDKKREALRKARLFAGHISLRHVSEIVSLRYGKRQFDDWTYREDPNWLIFKWRDSDGLVDTFNIIE